MPDYTAGKARILLEPSARGFFSKAKAEIRKDLAANGGGKLEQDVRLRPNITRFREDADTLLRGMRQVQYRVQLTPHVGNRHIFASNAKERANTALTGIRASIAVTPWIDTTKATNQMTAWRLKEEAKPLKIKVITEHVGGVGRPRGNTVTQQGGASQQILQPGQTQAFGHRVPILGQPTVTPNVNPIPATGQMAALATTVNAIAKAKSPTFTPKIDQSVLKMMSQQISKALEPKRVIGPSFRGVELLQPSVLAVASQALPALTASLGYAIGAIQQLAGAAMAVPGAMAVMGSSITTAALGISGMGDAFKAMTQAQEQAVTSADTDAARFESSQNQMRNALVDQQKAQEDLTRARKDARRELEDLHDEERSSYLSVAESALALQEARNELASSTAARGTVDYNQLVIRELRARESLREALQRQGRTREDVAEADKKGIENSDRVVSAQESLVRSNQQVAQSLEALKNNSSAAAQAQDKVNYALSRLSPAAGDAVRTLFDLKDKAFIPLRNAISENMFANFSQNLRALVDADLPILQKGLTGIATGINENMTQVMSSLRTPGTQSIMERIFGNTEEFHKRLTAAIDPAIRGLGTLAAAGSNAMPRIATSIGKVAEKFADWIEKADKDGRLEKWIDKGIEGFGTLFRIIKNLGTTFSGIGRAFGGGLLQTIERLTKRMSDFFNSAEGMARVRELINMVRRDWEDWRPILEDLPRMFYGIMQGGRTAMHAIMPVINTITSLLSAFPGLAQGAFAAFIGWRFLKPQFEIVSTALSGMVTALDRKIPAAANTAAGSVGKVGAATNRMSKLMALPAIANITTAYNNLGTTMSRAVPQAARNMATQVGSHMATFGGHVRNVGTKAVTGLRTAMAGASSFIGGPWAAVIGVTAVVALGALADGHEGAKLAAENHKTAVDQLKTSLDSVTQSAGTATRALLGQEMQNYQPGANQGLTGNVQAAVESLGIGGTEFMKAILPDADPAQAKAFNDKFFQTAKPGVLSALGDTGIRETLNADGIDDDTIVRAFLGDKEAVRRIESVTTGALNQLDYEGWNLGELEESFMARATPEEKAAALGGQFLNAKRPAMVQSQQEARAGQEVAAGGKPTFTPDGARVFGAGAEPFWDGSIGKVEVPRRLDDAQIAALEARGSTAEYDEFRGVTTVTLSDEDRRAMMNVPAMKAGGPTPESGMRGPTGGVMAELHPKEWVLPEHARSRLGDEWLWEQTRNKTMKRNGNSYFWGGPFPLTPPLPGPTPTPTPAPTGDGVVPPGMGTGPAPGPSTPSAPSAAQQAGEAATRAMGDDQTPQIGVSHAGGPGVPPGSPMDPNAAALLDAPMPTVDAEGNLVSPQAGDTATPDIGTAFQDMFLAPWGFKTGADGQPVPVGGQGGSGAQKAPGQWLGEWGGQFITSLGETLINGVLGFFGLSTDNTYFNALKKTLGFYSGKLGQQGQDQYVDPATQALINENVQGYTTLVDPATGTTYLVPSDGGTGDIPELMPGATSTRLQDTGSVSSGPQVQQAAALIEQKWGDIITKPFGGSRDTNTVKGTHDAGLSIDIPIDPGQEETGDAIAAYFNNNKEALGVEYVLWKQKDHFDHIDIHFNGEPGVPALDAGGGDDLPEIPELPDDGGTPPVSSIPSAPTGPAPSSRPGAPTPGRSAGVIPPGWRNVNAPFAKKWMLVPDKMYKEMRSSTAPPRGWYWERNDPHAPTDPSGGRAMVLTPEGQGPGTPAYNKIWGGPKGSSNPLAPFLGGGITPGNNPLIPSLTDVSGPGASRLPGKGARLPRSAAT